MGTVTELWWATTSAAGRLRKNLTGRQAVALGLVAALGVGAVGAALADHQPLATALVCALLLGLFAGVMQLRRRVSQEVQSVTARLAGLSERVVVAQRQVLAAVESERLAMSDRWDELRDVVEGIRCGQRQASLAVEASIASLDGVRSGIDEVRTRIDTAIAESDRRASENSSHVERRLADFGLDQLHNTEALLQLFRDFTPRAPMPPSGGWALDPVSLLELLFLVEEHRPQLVVELGSGTSSVWLGYALERNGGRLVSVDHDREFAERTRIMLTCHGLGGVAEVRLAPLQPLQVGQDELVWYDIAAVEDLTAIDLLLVDGPPMAVASMARLPALPVLETRLSDAAVVMLDDLDRPDEREALRRWVDDVPGLTVKREIRGRQVVLAYRRPGSAGSDGGATD